MTHVFRSPKFHKDQRKELRMQYGPDKAISNSEENSEAASVRRGSRPQASSVESQASSSIEPQASSSKLQAPSTLVQASSRKRQAP